MSSDPLGRSLLIRAQHLIRLHRSEEAAALLAQVLASDPTDVRAHRLLSQCMIELKRFKDALMEANAAIVLDPNAEWSFRLRSAALLGLGKKRAAVSAAREAVRLAPEHYVCFIQLAVAYRAAHRWPAAQEAAEQALRLSPESPVALNLLGVLALRGRRVSAAEAAFRKALRIDPNNANALNHRGIVARARGRRVEAHDFYGASSRADPRSAVPFRNAARVSNSLICEVLFGIGATCWAAAWQVGSDAPARPLLWVPTVLFASGVLLAIWVWRKQRDQYRPALLRLTLRPVGYLVAVCVASVFTVAIGVMSGGYGLMGGALCLLAYARGAGPIGRVAPPRTLDYPQRSRGRDRRVRHFINGALIFLIGLCGLLAAVALFELIWGSTSDPTSDIVAELISTVSIGGLLLVLLFRVMLPLTRAGAQTSLLDELEAELAAEKAAETGQ
jgi:tetratricopeptide (TPR) repeat protein